LDSHLEFLPLHLFLAGDLEAWPHWLPSMTLTSLFNQVSSSHDSPMTKSSPLLRTMTTWDGLAMTIPTPTNRKGFWKLQQEVSTKGSCSSGYM
jgi:hypothetical protein